MLIVHLGNFLSGSVVKNLPCNAGDLGSIPGRGSKAPHTSEELSLCVATTEQLSPNTTTTEPAGPGARSPQLERKDPA